MKTQKSHQNNINININDNRNINEAIRTLSKDIGTHSLIDILKCLILIRNKEFSDSRKKLIESLSKGNLNVQVLIAVFFEINKINEEMHFTEFLKCLNPFIPILIQNQEFLNNLDKLLLSIGFKKDNSEKNLKLLGQYFLGPLINKSYETNFFELALRLENIYYNILVTGIETDLGFEFGMELIKEKGTKAGIEFQKMFPFPTNLSANDGIHKVGFFIHNASMLAHIENIYSFLKYNENKINITFLPIIFCFNGRHDNFHKLFNEIGVEIQYLDQDSNGEYIENVTDRFKELKKRSQTLNLSKMIWVCLATYMSFAFGMRLAPEQIWWSQKWTKLKLPTIDKYFYSGSFALSEIRNGHVWKTGWIQRESWLDKVDFNDVNKIKNSFNGKLILGSFAREDKLKNPEYIAMVSSILNQNPDTIFIWTGRNEISQISSIFKQHGILDRTYFIGWVNTSVYAHVVDILLDSFPTGNGVTAIQTMQAGKPVIFKSVEGSLSLFINTGLREKSGKNIYAERIKKIFQMKNGQESLFTCARNNNEYFAFANRLISSKTYRKNVGNAYKNFIQNLMTNPYESSDIFYRHLME